MENCIRECADKDQLRRCAETLNALQDEIQRKSQILNMAGNTVRLKILFLLRLEKELCPCDLSDILNMTVPAVSQHLKKLKEANLISNRKTGQTIFYSINSSESALLIPILESLNPLIL